jgi:hypothetical protein
MIFLFLFYVVLFRSHIPDHKLVKLTQINLIFLKFLFFKKYIFFNLIIQHYQRHSTKFYVIGA